MLSNYHTKTGITSTVQFRDWKIGATAASIGFTP
jgi:hypothetical protein